MCPIPRLEHAFYLCLHMSRSDGNEIQWKTYILSETTLSPCQQPEQGGMKSLVTIGLSYYQRARLNGMASIVSSISSICLNFMHFSARNSTLILIKIVKDGR